MLRVIFIFLLSVCLHNVISAQQLSSLLNWNQNFSNPAIYNTRALIYDDYQTISIEATSRNLGQTINNKPTTSILSIDYNDLTQGRGNKDPNPKLRLGMLLMNQSLPPSELNALFIKLGVAFHLPSKDAERSIVSFNLLGGINQYNLDANKLQTIHPNDQMVYSISGRIRPNFGFGGFYKRQFRIGKGGDSKPHRLYAGVSVPLLYDFDVIDESGDNQMKLLRRIHTQLGTILYCGPNYYLDVRANYQVERNAPANISANTRLYYKLLDRSARKTFLLFGGFGLDKGFFPSSSANTWNIELGGYLCQRQYIPSLSIQYFYPQSAYRSLFSHYYALRLSFEISRK